MQFIIFNPTYGRMQKIGNIRESQVFERLISGRMHDIENCKKNCAIQFLQHNALKKR
jgi:hypothetical protein